MWKGSPAVGTLLLPLNAVISLIPSESSHSPCILCVYYL